MNTDMQKIPMVDLTAQYKSIKKDIDGSIKSVITDTAFVGGKYVEQFEKKIAKYCDTKYAVGLNSGTDALYLALWALGIEEGDEVITSPFTFFATAEVSARFGAKPVFVDIDPKTFNIDAKKIEQKITSRTKAIIPVHIFGYPADMKEIMRLAKKYKLFVIEDACQAIGAKHNGKKIGSIGHVGAFSFFPSKNLGAYGDGGIITTNHKKLADKIRSLRNHGSVVKYYNDEIGVSSRLDGIQASILSAKLKYLNKWNKDRAKIAKQYNEILKDIEWIELPEYEINRKTTHVFHQYTIRVKNGKRNELQKYLAKKGIASMIYYPIPLQQLKAMKYLGYKRGALPEVEKASKEVLSLPIYPELKQKQIKYITQQMASHG